MRTHFRIFILAAILSIPVLTAILFLGLQAHTDTNIALQLLIKGQSILLILCLAIIFGIVTAIIFTHYWLKPLNMLEQDIATIASNPDQLLPPPADRRISLPVLDAQYQLRGLHQKVRQSIRQRQRLADAGEAVAKINHDLRNMLSSILLVTEQLE